MSPMSALMIVVFSITQVGAEAAQTITMSRTGYQIDVLDPGPAQSGTFESFKMSLPPQGGFASNINIQHQAYTGTLSDYVELSEAGLRNANLTISNSKIENDAYTVEAVGKLLGVDIEFHFYFKAIKSGNNIILATATIPSSRWETEKGLLLPIVNSLAAAKK